jgi:hypothetical protein
MKLGFRSITAAFLTAVCIFSVSVLFDSSDSISQGVSGPKIWPSMTPGPYAVGYTLMHEYDRTRTFRLKRDYFGEPTEQPIARPIQVSVWYPAEASAVAKHMRLEEYYQARATG